MSDDLNTPYSERVLDISLHDEDDHKKTYSQLLIEITDKFCELFHDEDKETYATIDSGTHHETWKIHSRGFRLWISDQFYTLTGLGISSNSLKDALATIEAKAVFDGACKKVYLRVAQLKNTIYLDICNEQWEVIEITPSGYKILQSSPVPFIRSKGMLAFVTPEPEGSIELLRNHLNVNNKDFPLVVGWILISLQASKSALPILILGGEQNTGKSETTKMLRLLTDPHTAPIRTKPKEDDLAVMAFNNYVIALDNLSGITPSFSDFLCCCSTGASQSKRQHYKDTDEVLINIKRPLILNGIDDLAKRGDMASRSIFVHLPLLAHEHRKSMKKLWDDFNQDLPLIFGSLLGALSHALKNLAKTNIDKLPRMADFALWTKAAEGSFGWDNEFMRSYQDNIDNIISATIESSPFAYGVKKFMDNTPEWSGSADRLLEILERDYIDYRVTNSQKWMKTPKKVLEQLRRHAPGLKALGIEITDVRQSSGVVITIKRMEDYHDIRGLQKVI